MIRRIADILDSNYSGDDMLKSVDPEQREEEGHGLPGQIQKGVVGTSNSIESDDHSTGPIGYSGHSISLDGPAPQDVLGLQGLERGYSAVPMSHVEGPNVKDLVGKENMIVQENTRLASTEDYLNLFQKESTATRLYYQGYMDAMDGKPLDEDLALLSKEYYNGYEEARFYNKTPQQSVGQNLFNMKPNSNSLPRPGEMTPEQADRGLNELTDGTNRATAGKTVFPIDVITKFFEV